MGELVVSPTLPLQLNEELELETVPETLQDVRTSDSDRGQQLEVLLKWKELPESEATWEDFMTITKLFPAFHLEDKVALWGGGNVRHQPIRFTYSRKGKRGKPREMGTTPNG